MSKVISESTKDVFRLGIFCDLFYSRLYCFGNLPDLPLYIAMIVAYFIILNAGYNNATGI